MSPLAVELLKQLSYHADLLYDVCGGVCPICHVEGHSPGCLVQSIKQNAKQILTELEIPETAN